MTGSYIISFSEGVTNLSFGPFSEADMCVPEELVKCIIIEQNVGSMRKPIEEIGNGKCAHHTELADFLTCKFYNSRILSSRRFYPSK